MSQFGRKHTVVGHILVQSKNVSLRYVPLVLGLLLIAAIALWGAWWDFSEARNWTVYATISGLRSHTAATAFRVQNLLQDDPELSLDDLPDQKWLRADWEHLTAGERQRDYLAIVTPGGRIVWHSDPERIGGILDPQWYIRRLNIQNLQLAEASSDSLAGKRSYDVQIPISVNSVVRGYCHAGVNADWLDAEVDDAQQGVTLKWLALFSLILLTCVACGISFVRFVRESAMLKQAVAMQHSQRLTELGRLAGGLAHEIRNPLNAIRLNLFTLQKKLEQGNGDMSEDEVEIFRETETEIERLEGLIRSVLGYARPREPENENTDVCREVESTVRFVSGLLDGQDIDLRYDVPRSSLIVSIDSDRLRQMLLNLLNNAQEVSKGGGEIEVHVTRRRGWVDIEVSDSGPGVSEADRDRIFEPFYTTKDSGTGLGLALVKRFAEEASGYVSCRAAPIGGATFRISLPLIKNREVKS